MEHSNQISEQVLLGIIGFFSLLIGGFFKMIANQNRTQEKLTKAIEDLSKNSNNIAIATEKGTKANIRTGKQVEKYNGHLAKLIQQGNEKTEVIANKATDKIMNAFQNVNEQVVEHQHIKATDHDE